MQIPMHELYLQRVSDTEVGGVYFQMDGAGGFPVIIIAGKYTDPETGMEIHRCACCASPRLDDVTEANDSCEYGKGKEYQNAV